MLQSNQKIIRHKVGLLNLAEGAGQRVEGLSSHGPVTRYVLPRSRRGRGRRCRGAAGEDSPGSQQRSETAETVVAYAVEYPAHGQVRVSNELRKRGVFVSPSGVRSTGFATTGSLQGD